MYAAFKVTAVKLCKDNIENFKAVIFTGRWLHKIIICKFCLNSLLVGWIDVK